MLVCTPPSFICYPLPPLSFSHKKKDHVVYLYIHPPPERVLAAFRVPFCSLTLFSLALVSKLPEYLSELCVSVSVELDRALLPNLVWWGSTCSLT